MKKYALDYTGERYLPWSGDYRTAYEHVHRYLVACQYVQNKRVLDIACGEGYGTAMLARVAASVIGLDIDADTLRHAQTYHKSANVQFVRADAQRFNCTPGSIDAVVSFETIEHIIHPIPFLDAMKLALAPDGLLIISTPNQHVYHEFGDEMNPFHARELDRDDFTSLLEHRFRYVQILGQKLTSNSLIAPVAADYFSLNDVMCEILTTEINVTEIDYPLRADNMFSPRYFVAVCSDHPIPRISASIMVDVKEVLSRSETHGARQTQQIVDAQAAEVGALSEKVESLSQRMRDCASEALILHSEIVRQAKDLRRYQAEETRRDLVLAENAQTIANLRAQTEAQGQHVEYQTRYIERQHALIDEWEGTLRERQHAEETRRDLVLAENAQTIANLRAQTEAQGQHVERLQSVITEQEAMLRDRKQELERSHVQVETVYADLLELRAALDRIEQSVPGRIVQKMRRLLGDNRYGAKL